MKKLFFVVILLGLVPFTAGAADSLVRFEGGIGVQPVSGIAAGAPVSNTVRGFGPGGLPWVIAGLTADVRTDGRIKADVKGLVLAAGGSIGTAPAVHVRAVLLCGAANTSTAHFSEEVVLPPNGDVFI